MDHKNIGKFALLAAFVMVVGLASASEYKSVTGGFKVTMPGTAEESTQAVPFGAGELTQHIVYSGNDESAFFASYLDYPTDLMVGANSEKALETGLENINKMFNATTLRNEKVTFGGNTGRDATFEGVMAGKHVTITVRAVIVRNRLYQVLVLTTNPAANVQETAKFINSFEIAAN